MKKTLLMLSLFAILLTSCNGQNEDLFNVEKSFKTNESFLVPESRAIEQAISFFNAKEKSKPSRKRASVKRRTLAALNTCHAQAQEGVYIINFENNGGFAVVSADKRDNVSVYIASPDGSFDENNNACQELLFAVKNYQKASISSYASNPDKGDATYTETTTVEENYGPLLSTCWWQKGVFNRELKNIYGENVNSPMGCVPVAIGQIINYYQYPDKIREEYIDWDLISQVSGREIYSTPATNAASRLLYIIGLGLGIDYPNESGASYDDAVGEFRKLGYTFATKKGYNATIVKKQISQGNPVYMRGQNDDGGHAWVADGFMKIKTEYRVYDENGNLVENTVLNDYNYDNIYDYIHLNLGWGESSLVNKMSRFEYQSSIDQRVWVYTDIFNFSDYGSHDLDFNTDIKLIYGFSHN